jgi:nucleoside-diphosphate-sugar epimerase
VAQIAEEIRRQFGTGKISYVTWPDERKRIEIEQVRISSERFRDLVAWRPAYDFKQGLARTKAIVSGALHDLEPLVLASAVR